MSELTPELLRECLIYSDDTGDFIWRMDRPPNHFSSMSSMKVFNTKFGGKVAGHRMRIKGMRYIQIRIFGKLYFSHRLVILYKTNKWPENIIDHIDGNGLNNRFDNLRDCDSIINGRNCNISKNNKSGVNGVYWNKINRKWIAEGHYTNDGKKCKVYLGSFASLSDAKSSRKLWEESQITFTNRHGSSESVL